MPNLRPAARTRNAQLDRYRDLIDDRDRDPDAPVSGPGTIAFYAGPQPSSSDQRIGTQTLLGILTFAKPCAPDAVDGVLTFNPIAEESAARAKGRAAWARISDGDGETVFDCDVTDIGGGGTIEINESAIAQGGPIRCSSFKLTAPQG